MTPAAFIAKWKDNKLPERAGAQAHFLDLCELMGVGKPDDPEHYCFERGARRTRCRFVLAKNILTVTQGFAETRHPGFVENCIFFEFSARLGMKK